MIRRFSIIFLGVFYLFILACNKYHPTGPSLPLPSHELIWEVVPGNGSIGNIVVNQLEMFINGSKAGSNDTVQITSEQIRVSFTITVNNPGRHIKTITCLSEEGKENTLSACYTGTPGTFGNILSGAVGFDRRYIPPAHYIRLWIVPYSTPNERYIPILIAPGGAAPPDGPSEFTNGGDYVLGGGIFAKIDLTIS